MYNNIFLTDEQINIHLAKVLDASLSTDHDYQTLVASCHKTCDALVALHLPNHQWQIVDDYINAIYEYLAAYATAAYRLGFRDGTGSVNLPALDVSCPDITNLVLDTLEDDTLSISWQPSNRPELAQTIADVLIKLAKEE